MIEVIDSRGRTLTPCRRKVAEREVRLNRAKWIGPGRIRLRFDPFAYRYIRLKVLERDRYICYWCGEPGETMDHVVPWSKGGRTTMDNCICACQECNGMRGDMPAAEFARLRGVAVPRPGGAVTPAEPPQPKQPLRIARGSVGRPVEAPVARAVSAAARVAAASPGAAAAVALAPKASPVLRPTPVPVAVPAPRATAEPEPVAILRPHAIRDLLDPWTRPSYRHG
ncbi:MAG TPA: HNH endonuclease signature motif containing protein [Symbiobacteriaceae bacterium]|jgi:hypothetical protein|nr:HNH endonuclease signature motif containing protein [Symbiobacteriaceae bacterium]